MQSPGALCVSLTPRSLDEVFSPDLSGDLSAADCAEIRLDYLTSPRDSVLARWDKLRLPVIATCRGRERGGRFAGSIQEEIQILQYAVENGAKFVDIDYRFARPMPGATVIASLHDFEATPPDLVSLMDRVCGSPGDIAKIATTVKSWDDNRRLLDLLKRRWPKPVIVIGMGEIGQLTRIIGPARGSFLTYAGLSANAAAPGQLSIRDMTQVYRFRRAGPATRLIGILGNPLGHSLSPHIHNRAFEARNLDFVYAKFPAPDLKDFFDNASAIGIYGCSVTIPHKTAAMAFLHDLTPEARAIGAINTIVAKEGKWFGDNTDVHGVRAALASEGFDPADKAVVILGAGGAAKAAAAAVSGAKRVEMLSRREVPEAAKHPCDLLINATPVGMFPMVDATPVAGPIPAEAVFDMVYNPPVTRLLRSARDQGKITIQGTTMFLAQAARQFEIWTGHRAPSEIFEEKTSLS
jgi:3-dehydroquinate dehydratase/shikimate dehydrogenase